MRGENLLFIRLRADSLAMAHGFHIQMSTVNKRRRTASNNGLCINGLPDALLSHVAIYLAKPSQALFAISLPTQTQTPNNSLQTTIAGNAIISASSPWRILDFGDIDKSLAAKLTDDHVRAILTCIDAPNNLKRLKLAGCVNITGSGLDIIRSAALEHIDLSLVGKYEKPTIDPKPQLSENFIIPILDGIMERGCLKLIHLPKHLRCHSERTREMEQFLDRYNRYICTFGHTCSNCDGLCESPERGQWIHEFSGTQYYTCSQCLTFFCYGDECSDDNVLQYCSSCEKDYCHNCALWERCLECQDAFCEGCKVTKVCEGCGDTLCESCMKNLMKKCFWCDKTRCNECIKSFGCEREGCNKTVCADCTESKGEGGACDTCDKSFCGTECQYLLCDKAGDSACSVCTKDLATTFRRKLHESQKEVEQLCQGMDDLYKKYVEEEG